MAVPVSLLLLPLLPQVPELLSDPTTWPNKRVLYSLVHCGEANYTKNKAVVAGMNYVLPCPIRVTAAGAITVLPTRGPAGACIPPTPSYPSTHPPTHPRTYYGYVCRL